MKRRDFIIVVGVAAALRPFAARAQSPTKPPIIGYLFPEFASSQNQWTAAFVRRFACNILSTEGESAMATSLAWPPLLAASRAFPRPERPGGALITPGRGRRPFPRRGDDDIDLEADQFGREFV